MDEIKEGSWVRVKAFSDSWPYVVSGPGRIPGLLHLTAKHRSGDYSTQYYESELQLMSDAEVLEWKLTQ